MTRPPQMNLMTPQEEEPRDDEHFEGSSRRSRSRTILFYGISLFFIVVLIFGYQIIFAEHTFLPFANIPFFRAMRSLARSNDILLKGEDMDRINVLLLGMGGAGHEGPYLTDTIMLASIQPSTRRVALLSIPRDLVIPIGSYGWRKINAANAFGELEHPGNGGAFVSEHLSTLLRVPIHYYVRVDFEGFRRLIDDLGGIVVTVERSFVDQKYPTTDYKYQEISFSAGEQLLSGERALQYVRSRHGNNGEGSDFARARRQQQVLAALKEQLYSFWTLTSPSVISSLVNTFENNVQTNMNLGEMVRFARLFQGARHAHIETVLLDASKNGYLKETNYEGAFILEPKTGNFDAIRDRLAHIFDGVTAPVPASTAATLDIRNGTRMNGLASTLATRLKKAGFSIMNVANAPEQRFAQTVIIDRTFGMRDADAQEIQRLLGTNAEILIAPSTDRLTEDERTRPLFTTADFLIILGQDQTQPYAPKHSEKK